MEKYANTCFFKTLNGSEISSKSYFEYLRDIKSCAYMLEQNIGDIENKHIGIIAHSGYKYYVLMFAIMFSRAVAVPINENETLENITFAIKNSDVDVLIVENQKDICSFDDLTILKMDNLFVNNTLEKDLKEFSEDESERLAIILYTSGTTSLSKGVALSADNVFHDYVRILPEIYFNDLDKAQGALVYTNFPCYHLGGLLAFLSFSENGCTICYSKDQRNILSDLERIVIDFAAVTPAVLKLWVNCIKHDRMDRLGNLKHIISGGAIIEPNYVRYFNKYGITVGQFYGQTESGGAVICNFDMEKHIDAVGKAVDGAKISIRDGEICIEYWGNMQGYYKNPHETEKVMRDGVVYSGDLGYIDEDGYVYINGRKKNLIILSGGENVCPEEIEARLYENRNISECKVYEKNDSIYADIFAPEMSPDQVKAYVKELNKKMPIYKRINHVEYQENELEKTSVGKIKR